MRRKEREFVKQTKQGNFLSYAAVKSPLPETFLLATSHLLYEIHLISRSLSPL